MSRFLLVCLARTARALSGFLVVGAVGCGTGTDGKPVAPPTAPAPPPAPEPPPPPLRAVAELWSQPSGPEGYYTGERIRVVLDFTPERTTVKGSPRLAIQIGEHVRLADFSPWVEDDFPPERPSFLQRFEYEVGADDEDTDGITIAADAFDYSEGAFLNAAGVQIEVDIHGIRPRHSADPVDPGEALDTHRVLGPPVPRVCTDERELALNHSQFVREWDGTPFRVDMIHNFPDPFTEADTIDLLGAVAHLDEKIERQLGYRILEMGDVIPVPQGLPPGWNTDEQAHRRTCPLPRERGHIQGFYMDDTNHGAPAAGAQANSRCGDFCYLRPMIERWRAGREYDGVTLHEVFHVLGYVHFDDDDFFARRQGVPMSVSLTRAQEADAEAVLWTDIDLLRCIFPESG